MRAHCLCSRPPSRDWSLLFHAGHVLAAGGGCKGPGLAVVPEAGRQAGGGCGEAGERGSGGWVQGSARPGLAQSGGAGSSLARPRLKPRTRRAASGWGGRAIVERVRAAPRLSSAAGAVAWASERRLPIRNRLRGAAWLGAEAAPVVLCLRTRASASGPKERPRGQRGRLGPAQRVAVARRVPACEGPSVRAGKPAGHAARAGLRLKASWLCVCVFNKHTPQPRAGDSVSRAGGQRQLRGAEPGEPLAVQVWPCPARQPLRAALLRGMGACCATPDKIKLSVGRLSSKVAFKSVTKHSQHLFVGGEVGSLSWL